MNAKVKKREREKDKDKIFLDGFVVFVVRGERLFRNYPSQVDRMLCLNQEYHTHNKTLIKCTQEKNL